MNLSRVESYARELQAIIKQVEQAQAEIDHLNGFLQMADRVEDHAQELQIKQRRDEVAHQRETIVALVLEKSNRADYDRAKELVEDLAARINKAHEEYSAFRRATAEYEFLVALDEPDFDRTVATTQLERAHARVKLRVQQATELFPNKAVVLL